MFKFFQLTVLFTLGLTALTAQASLSATVPLSQKAQSSKVVKQNVNVPICYMETASGNVLNLSNLCKQEATNSSNRFNRISPRSRNDSRMKKSDDELYGKGN